MWRVTGYAVIGLLGLVGIVAPATLSWGDATTTLQQIGEASRGNLRALDQALRGLQDGTGLAAGAIDTTDILDATIEMSDMSTSLDQETDFTFSSASTSGGTSVEPINVATTMTGAGGVGGRANFNLTTTAALGSWSNALKALVTYGTGGATTGLGSAMVAEVVMGPDSDQGNFGVLELEFGVPDASTNPDLSSFIHGVAYGDTEELAALQADLAIMSLQGLSDTTGGAFDSFSEDTSPAVHATLKVRVGATVYYLPLCGNASCGDN